MAGAAGEQASDHDGGESGEADQPHLNPQAGRDSRCCPWLNTLAGPGVVASNPTISNVPP